MLCSASSIPKRPEHSINESDFSKALIHIMIDGCFG